jgi:hypothetical protein
MKKINFNKNIMKALLVPAVILYFMQGVNSPAAEYKTTTTLTADKAIGSPITWKVAASQEDAGEGLAKLPARLCFSCDSRTDQQCELAEGQTVSNLEVLPFTDKTEPSGILFLANRNGLGGGPDYMGLWVYDKASQRFKNILPDKVCVKALGVYTFFPSLNNKSVLVIADPETLVEPDAKTDDPNYAGIWSPHLYLFSVYTYSKDKGFVQAGSFKTKEKHSPEDENLIDSEMENIKNLLK